MGQATICNANIPHQSTGSPLLIQLPANVPGNAVKDGRSTGTATHMTEQDVVPGYQLRPGPDLAIAATWDMNQQLGDYVSVSLSLSLSNK